jgi:RHS repeat-associated protein
MRVSKNSILHSPIPFRYEYGPFGEVFCSVGDMAKVNPFGFSTKYTDNETDLVYYGYRYYSPALGRWLSRDPIEEKGGLNLYGFVNNDPVNYVDIDGLKIFDNSKIKYNSQKNNSISYTSIELCTRSIENPCNDIIIGIANMRGHDFFRWEDVNGNYDSIGFQYPQKRFPERDNPELARSCKKCYKTSKKLKYGYSASIGKQGYDASDEEIQHCLRSRPITRKWFCDGYHGFFNNCNVWASGAAVDCGISCSGDYFIPRKKK